MLEKAVYKEMKKRIECLAIAKKNANKPNPEAESIDTKLLEEPMGGLACRRFPYSSKA